MENPIPIPIFILDHSFRRDILQASDGEACSQPVLKTKCGAGFRVCPDACYIPCITFCLEIRILGVNARYGSSETIVMREPD